MNNWVSRLLRRHRLQETAKTKVTQLEMALEWGMLLVKDWDKV